MSNWSYSRLLVLSLFTLFFHQGGTAQQTARATLSAKIDRLLQSQVDDGMIPGAVIQVKKDGQTILKKAYGFAQIYDQRHQRLARPEKTSTGHLYDLASLTKVVGTTTSVMLLADRGLLGVDDPVGKYIEAFNTTDKKAITVRHLLTHSAGLYEWYPLYYRVSNRQDCYRLIGELPLKYPVGQQRKYSDLGFVLLGQIIEKVSGLSLEKFMAQNIFGPLGMRSTTYNPLTSGDFKKIAATSHGNPYEKRMVYDPSLGFQVKEIDPTSWNGWRTYTLKGEVNDGNAWYANGGISGAAGLFSTIDDVQKLVDMLMNKGKAGGRTFISEKTIRTFLTPDTFRNGLGWMMDPESGFMKNAPEGSYGHTGFTGTSIVVMPKYGISVILFINRQNMGLLETGQYYDLGPVRRQVLEAVLEFGK